MSSAKNGVGAFIPACRKLVIHYCERSGSSRHLRGMLIPPPSSAAPNTPSRFVRALADRYPHVEIVVSPRPSKHPVIRGLYLMRQGDTSVCIKNLEEGEVWRVLREVVEGTGRKVTDVRKVAVRSTTESVRGAWSPFKNPLRI